MRDMLLVLNFDNDASRAITRKLRSERVFCKIVPGNISLEEIKAQEPLGLLLAGGVASASLLREILPPQGWTAASPPRIFPCWPWATPLVSCCPCWAAR